MNLFRTIILLVLFSTIGCVQKMNTKKVYNHLKNIDGNYQLDFDHGNFFSWENQDSLIIGTSYATVNQDTILSELHSFEILSDSLRYQVTVFNEEIPLTINYYLEKVDKSKFTFKTNERDFPEKLIFEILEDTLFITREGKIVGTEQSITETYLKNKKI